MASGPDLPIMPVSTAPRVNVLGVDVTAQTMAEAVTQIKRWIELRIPTYICTHTVYSIVDGRRHPDLREIYNRAGMAITEDMSLVWACHQAGHTKTESICGPDLMTELSAASCIFGWRHYFYGAPDNVLEELKFNLSRRFLGVPIVGSCARPLQTLSEAEDHAVIDRINAAQPDIVWVGLGSPEQDRWMAAHRGRVSAPIMIGVGPAFDFIAETKLRTPRRIRRRGLEWLFRFLLEPWRLGPRYVVRNIVFIGLMAWQWLTVKPTAD